MNISKQEDLTIKVNYGTSGQTWDGGDLRGIFRGAQKESDGKLKWDSFLWKALTRVNIRWQENKSNYPVHNHLLPLSRTDLEDAIFRHYLQLKDGDTSEDHLSAIALNAMMIIEAQENKSLIEDGIKEWIKSTVPQQGD